MKKTLYQLNTSMIRLWSGTYETIWEVRDDEDDNGNILYAEYNPKELIAEIAKEYQYHKDEILEALNIDWILDITFTGAFFSPREYNFMTDSLDFNLIIDRDKLLKYLTTIKNNKDLATFLIDHYRSRDGFISYTPDNIEELIEEIVNEGDSEDQAISALINYLIDTDAIYDLEYQIYEDWSCNGYGDLEYKYVKGD